MRTFFDRGQMASYIRVGGLCVLVESTVLGDSEAEGDSELSAALGRQLPRPFGKLCYHEHAGPRPVAPPELALAFPLSLAIPPQ